MMKRKYILLTLAIVIIGITSVACGKNAENNSAEISGVQNEKTDTAKESEENVLEDELQNESSDSQAEQPEEPEQQSPVIELSNTYRTKFSTVHAVTYPDFTVDYPITFSHIGGVPEGQLGGGSSDTMTRVEVSKAGDSQFISGYVQAADHSDLGTFMVAKLKSTGQLDMQTDSDFQDVDGAVAYAVVPESWTGIRDDVRGAYAGEFAFWYSSYISFIAESPTGQFTGDEEREIIEILSSFRTEY